MTPRRILILLAIAAVVVGAALWLADVREPASTSAGGKVLPALSGAINSVTELRIVTAGGKNAVTVRREEDQWRVVERAGYPADSAKLRKLLLGLADLRTVEEKTADPANYARLSVEDPAAADATSVRVELVGTGQPVSVVVGKSAGGDSSYVRVADSATSLQAKPMLSVEREPRNWLDRSILDIPMERVQEVRITAGKEKPYVITRASREQTDFTIPDLPRGRKLSSPSAGNHIAGALASLTLDDVRKDDGAEWKGNVQRAEYRLFDGTTVTLTGYKENGDKNLVRLSMGFEEELQRRFAQATPAPASPAAPAAAADTAEAKSEAKPSGDAGAAAVANAREAAQSGATRLAGWIYEVPGYKYETFFQPLADLLAQ